MSDFCASFEDVIERIFFSTDVEINQILNAVIRWYGRHYPDWDVMFLSLPKESEARRKQLERMLEMLKNGDTI